MIPGERSSRRAMAFLGLLHGLSSSMCRQQQVLQSRQEVVGGGVGRHEVMTGSGAGAGGGHDLTDPDTAIKAI